MLINHHQLVLGQGYVLFSESKLGLGLGVLGLGVSLGVRLSVRISVRISRFVCKIAPKIAEFPPIFSLFPCFSSFFLSTSES